MSSERPLKSVALIGCGRWGRNIGRVLSQLGALRVIVDPATEALAPLARELNADILADPRAVFDDPAIAAVAIAAPAADHARLVSEALAAGKHVFVEKPLALEVEDAERLARQADEAGLVLMVGHLLQYHPAFLKLKAMVEDGVIGELRHITSNRLNPGAIRTEENALWSMAPHDFSMVLALAGQMPGKVDALATSVVQPTIPDEFNVQMRFSDALTAAVRVSWLSPFKEHKLVALGTKGALVFEDTAAPDRKLVLYKDYVDASGEAPRFVKGPGEPVEFPGGEPLRDELSWFLQSVDGAVTTRTGPAEAIPVLKVLQEASLAASRNARTAEG